MAKKKIKRKQLLKEPDEFLTLSARMLQWMARHRERLLWAAAAVFFVAASVAGWMYYQSQRQKRAARELGRVVAVYHQAQAASATDAQKARVKAMLAAFVKAYADTGSGKMGRVLYANLCYRTGDLEKAVALYRRSLEDFKDRPLLKNVILSSLGHAFLKKKDPKQATRYFEQVAAGRGPLLKDEALFILAKLSEKSGDTRAASEKMQRLLSDFPNSLYSLLIKEAVKSPK